MILISSTKYDSIYFDIFDKVIPINPLPCRGCLSNTNPATSPAGEEALRDLTRSLATLETVRKMGEKKKKVPVVLVYQVRGRACYEVICEQYNLKTI